MALVQIKHRPQLKGHVKAATSVRRPAPRRALRGDGTNPSFTKRFTGSFSELDGEYVSGSMTQRYAHGLGTDQPLAAFSGAGVGTGALKYLYTDRQGSVIALADSGGTVTQKYAYGPWGEPNSWTGSRFMYTGQTVIPEANLYYYKARIYDPNYGRFLQTDPIGSKDDLDLYAYTGNDPVNKSDPTGGLSIE